MGLTWAHLAACNIYDSHDSHVVTAFYGFIPLNTFFIWLTLATYPCAA